MSSAERPRENARLQPPNELALLGELFEHLPDVAFFVKDAEGRYCVVNQSLVERVGFQHRRDLLGRHVREVFPADLAERYAAQDAAVVRTGRPIRNRLELHWYPRRRTGWCLTTKFAWRGEGEQIRGVIGISRDLRTPGDSSVIPAGLAPTLEFLEANFGEPMSPSGLAKRAGLSSARFARLIKRIFGLTPSQLITQTRLAGASRLLEATSESVADIALRCGFYDHSAFTRAFRSATALTPTQYRRQRKHT